MVLSSKRNVIPLREAHAIGAEVVADSYAERRGSSKRRFPLVSTLPRLPLVIPDEILDYYGWVFCQGGFLNLQMTFEQFLAVVAAVSPSGLSPEYDASEASYPND